MKERVLEAKSVLTERQRQAWELVVERDLSLRQAGVVMGVSKSTVKGHVDKARERIYDQLREAA